MSFMAYTGQSEVHAYDEKLSGPFIQILVTWGRNEMAHTKVSLIFFCNIMAKSYKAIYLQLMKSE